jgi:hypothetical protein
MKRKASGFAEEPPAYLGNLPEQQRQQSWRANISRAGGFWPDDRWYDLQIERRMPGVKKMWEEMVFAVPPCNSANVLDLLSGSGRASVPLMQAYPDARLTLLDQSQERISMAKSAIARLPSVISEPRVFNQGIDITKPVTIPGISSLCTSLCTHL